MPKLERIVQFEMNDFTYELATYGDLLRITCNDDTIHVQQKEVELNNNIGLKSINEIIGSFAEYITFCETVRPYFSIGFWDDECAKRTDIYAKITFFLQDGSQTFSSWKIDKIMSEMKGGLSATSLINDYECFVYNTNFSDLKDYHPQSPIMSKEKLIEISNKKNHE
ncbi:MULTISPECIES: hypothetical protein [Bacillus cereus group]|uniref:Uncharacterized protein n=1 Tax=Bacillus thuringiensis TaxID=1428 RepID=A0AB33B5P4_BACTU|nr:hypothetical protein [Bacillus thuringiensis]AJG79534.1 hypothetical protein BF38_5443 [Bacillus thuringiensis]EEM73933.1 hypothetical protein bthur0010_60570 [Bacillus thuringiensis serovar pondicheriensis BGSC 4BA1]MCU5430294.1 hypothetical protein [Bacillus cereus]